jgi:hypothetical protein
MTIYDNFQGGIMMNMNMSQKYQRTRTQDNVTNSTLICAPIIPKLQQPMSYLWRSKLPIVI